MSCRRIRSYLRCGCTRALAARNSAVRDFFHRAWACGVLAHCKSVFRVSSHRPLVGVVCRISRAGKHMGSWRWQLLGRHTLNFPVAIRMDDDPRKGNRASTAVRFRCSGERRGLSACPRTPFQPRASRTIQRGLWFDFGINPADVFTEQSENQKLHST